MKSVLTIICCLFLSFQLNAQFQFKVTLNDEKIYEVFLKSNENFNPPLSITSAGQITLSTLSGSFKISELTSVNGKWNLTSTLESPGGNPDYDYFVFGLSESMGSSGYQKNEELLLFTFKNEKDCTSPIEILDNEKVYSLLDNNNAINIGNLLSVFGAGINNAYSGNYAVGTANCTGVTSIELEHTIENQGITSKIIQWKPIENAKSYIIKMRPENQTEWLNSISLTVEKVFAYLPKDKNFEYQIDILLKNGQVENSPIYTTKNESLRKQKL